MQYLENEPKRNYARTFSLHSLKRSDLELNIYWPGKGGSLGPGGESYTMVHVTPCPPESQGFQYCTVFSLSLDFYLDK